MPTGAPSATLRDTMVSKSPKRTPPSGDPKTTGPSATNGGPAASPAPSAPPPPPPWPPAAAPLPLAALRAAISRFLISFFKAFLLISSPVSGSTTSFVGPSAIDRATSRPREALPPPRKA